MLVDLHWKLLQTTGSQPTTCNLCTSLAGLDDGRQTLDFNAGPCHTKRH